MLDNLEITAHLDALAKPPGSMGRLEKLAADLARIQQRLDPVTCPRRLILFAADHGVVADGVSAWPQAVTGAMMATIAGGKATSSALAAAHDCQLELIDAGAAHPPPGAAPPPPPLLAGGTASLAHGPAMNAAQFAAAWQLGEAAAERAAGDGVRLLLLGEMGIGNTTPAACLTMLLTGASADIATGRGAGADDAALARKRAIVAAATARAIPVLAEDAHAAIAMVAGFEIVAMAGCFAAAATAGLTLLLDGYVTTAAALVAEHLVPGTAKMMIAGHLSAEPGHRAALAQLGLAPILEWQMRLGEGSGALVALPLLDSAAALIGNVALLSEVVG
ncbi:MAG: nicotinate-nucleotide--dimethylbenzimidazole phosphoribosyltransferase [Erythrobacter sp.]